MTRRVVVALSLLFVSSACEREPTAPQARNLQPSLARAAAAATATAYDPPRRQFGPDSRETGGPYTGRGVAQPGLGCTGLASGRRKCEGYLPSDVDGTLLDVTVDVPADPTPGSPNDSENVPLVALLHGWAGSKTGSGDIAERLLDDGIAVLRYSARGFGNSFGRVNLSDIGVEVAPPADPTVCAARPGGDLQSMIGEVVDRVVDEAGRRVINPTAVAVTGASYGGGQSWLATLRPRFNSPGGNCVTIKTVVPIVPWTDLLYSLLPNGDPANSVDPLGALKFSYVNALYVSGCRKGAVGTPPCENYPTYLKIWHAWLNIVEPNRFDPVFRRIRDGVAGYRSIWWQRSFWEYAAASKLPVFQVQGFTDDLFTLEEAKRMLLALETTVPEYPIKSYFGDIGHPRAHNKTDEVEHVLDLIEDWLTFYLKNEGPQPEFDIQAAITGHFGEPFTGNVIRAKRYSELSTRAVTPQADCVMPPLTNPISGAPSGPPSDPVLEAGMIAAAGELRPYVGLPPVPNVVDPTAVTCMVPAERLGAPTLIAGQPTVRLQGMTTGVRVQFNVRVYDVGPDRLRELVTRGTLTAETRTRGDIGALDVTIPTAGNLWCVLPGHVLQFEISNVDAPYLAPSRVPSGSRVSSVEITVPVREAPGQCPRA